MEKLLKYKTFDNVEMDIKLYFQKSNKEKYPLVVFFFGGGWVGGRIDAFKPQALELIKLGYMVATVDYRVFCRHKATIDICMRDAFYSLKFFSDNADELGIDKDFVCVGGESAGGQLAITSVMLNNVKHDLNIRGIAMFNAGVDTTKARVDNEAIINQAFDPVIYSPYHHIRENLPPVLLLHGTADIQVRYDLVVKFADKYRSFGNSAKLVTYEGCEHSFFHTHKGGEEYFWKTLDELIKFLEEVKG